MAPDGAIWVAGGGPGYELTGLYRISPDGAAIEQQIGGDSPQLLYCTSSISQLQASTRGDIYYVFRNDLSADFRIFKIAAGTNVGVELAKLDFRSAEFPNGPLGPTSSAIVGDTLYFTISSVVGRPTS